MRSSGRRLMKSFTTPFADDAPQRVSILLEVVDVHREETSKATTMSMSLALRLWNSFCQTGRASEDAKEQGQPGEGQAEIPSPRRERSPRLEQDPGHSESSPPLRLRVLDAAPAGAGAGMSSSSQAG